MGVIKGQSHMVSPVSYQFASFSFHINQTNNSWNTAIWNLSLKQSRSRSWVRSKVKVTYNIPSIQPMQCLFVSHQSDQPFLRYGQNSVWPWKNIHNFTRQFAKITVSHWTFPKFNQLITMTRAIKHPCFVVIGWVVLTLSCRQAIFC